MRSARFITSGPGVVVIGLPDGGERDGIVARFGARGYDVAVLEIAPDATIDAALAQLENALHELRARLAAPARVAVAAYGAAGALGFLAVTRLATDGAAIVRGRGIVPYLRSDAKFARVPMSMHFDDADPAVPIADVRALKGALEGIGIIEIYRYERWDDAAAADAERRICEVLDTLGAPPG